MQTSVLNEHTTLSNCNTVTVPFYIGDVSIEDIKKTPAFNRQRLRVNSSVSNSLVYDIKCLSARSEHKPRTSKINIFKENASSIKLRNRSVSYLERFRKKLYGNIHTTSSTISVGGSDVHEQVKSMSYISNVDKDISITSEFEYYLNLTKSTDTEIDAMEHSSLTKLSKQKNSKMLNKDTSTILLPKINCTKQENEKKELEKKQIIKKKEAFANKVKLQNRFQINQHKEKLRKITSKEICHCQNIHNRTETSKNPTTMDLPPFLVNEVPTRKDQSNSKALQKKKVVKPLTPSRRNTTFVAKSNLTVLQQRHEREKTLVDSMRCLVLNI